MATVGVKGLTTVDVRFQLTWPVCHIC